MLRVQKAWFYCLVKGLRDVFPDMQLPGFGTPGCTRGMSVPEKRGFFPRRQQPLSESQKGAGCLPGSGYGTESISLRGPYFRCGPV